MAERKRILVIGLDPAVVDYSHFPDLDARKVRAGIDASLAALTAAGYEAASCEIDTGATAEAMVRARLSATPWDCIVIGAGVRTGPPYFLLFERVLNVVHRDAPGATICFNTRPTDTVEAVRRWM